VTTASKPAVVCNPTKANDIAQLREEITARCDSLELGEPQWYETRPDDAGARVTSDALGSGADLVIACGGDGTVAACAGVLAGSNVPLAVVPLGSGNLVARNLGLPLERARALDIAFGPGRRRLDLLESESRRFIGMAGLGLDAAMIRDTSDALKAKVGWPAYVIGIVRAMVGSRPVHYTVTVDDRPAMQHKAVGALIANIGQLQGGLAILPDARPDDGLLDLALLTPRSLRDWPVLVLRILQRRPDSGRQAQLLRGRRVRIETAAPVPLEYDGEDAGDSSDLTVEVLPGAILMCVEAT